MISKYDSSLYVCLITENLHVVIIEVRPNVEFAGCPNALFSVKGL